MKLAPHQAIEDFHAIVLEKGRRLKESDMDLINKSVGELPPQLAFFVRADHISSFHEALQSAKAVEAHGYRHSPTQKMVDLTGNLQCAHVSVDPVKHKLAKIT